MNEKVDGWMEDLENFLSYKRLKKKEYFENSILENHQVVS